MRHPHLVRLPRSQGESNRMTERVDDDVELPVRNLDDGPILYADGPSDLVAAAGHDDQRLYIVPSQDLVVVYLSDGSWGFQDRELLRLLLDGP